MTGRKRPAPAALNTAAVLADERFDFSQAYILAVGCAGTAEGYGIPGDVFVFPTGVTPEMLWGADDHIASENSMESVDFFETAMRSCFAAGRILIDAMPEGGF